MAGQSNTGEFEIIERYFAPLAKRTEGAFGLKDDAALFQPRPGYDLVMTKDAIVAGVHFLPADPYDLVAQKLVRVNVSDLAAKGAEPKAYLLALAWPEGVEEKDIALFAAGLQKDQDIYGLELLGGDTVKTPGPATFSLTAIGTVPHGEFIRRSGAKAGDAVYVTGTLGDAALGLKLARGDIDLLSISERRALIQRYRLPQPRVAVGAGLRGIASAGLDISDGLGADLLHLCKASGLRARISQSALPLSAPARQLLKNDETLWPSVLNGGDDYEIVFAAPGEAGVKLELLAGSTGVPITRIGYLEAGEPAVLLEDMSGRTEPLAESGYRHF